MNLTFVRSRAAHIKALTPRPAPAIVLPDDEFARIKRWESILDLSADGVKTFDSIVAVKDGPVVDYQNVRIKGYLSTFKNVTESDRQGDYVEPGAFTDTLKRFKNNPVMLADHINRTAFVAGSFSKFVEDKNGLYVEGLLSNSPDMQSVRFKVAEGHLRTLSMGGAFHYKEDGRGIFKVDLWEGSLTPIPANQDALFSVRALTDVEKKFIKSGAISFSDFVISQQAGAKH